MGSLYMVYAHIFPNNKIYIGITCQSSLERRSGQKGQGYKTQPLMWNAIKKYGWDNVKHIIVARGVYSSIAQEMERYLIKVYGTTNPKYGYNICTGGQLIPEEAIRIMSDNRMGAKKSYEHKKKIGLGNLGVKHSIDSIPNVRPVIRYNFKTGEYLGEYISVSDAARKYRIKPIEIANCASGNKRKAGDSVWFYKDDVTEADISKRLSEVRMPKNNCPIKVFNVNTGDVEYFESCAKASAYTNISQSHISRRIKDGKESRGFTFTRINMDEFFESTGMEPLDYYDSETTVLDHREYIKQNDPVYIEYDGNMPIRRNGHFSEIYTCAT